MTHHTLLHVLKHMPLVEEDLDYAGKFRYKETCYDVTAWTHHTLLHVLKHMPLVEEDSITLVSSGTKRHALRCDCLDPSHTASCVETHATRRGRFDYAGKFRYKETCYDVTAWTHHTLLHVLKHMPLVEEDLDYAGKFRYKETCYDVTAWTHHTLLACVETHATRRGRFDYAGKFSVIETSSTT